MTVTCPALIQVLLLWFAGLGAAAQFAKIAVPFAQVRAAYPETGDEIGWLLSLISLVGAVLGVVAGDLVRRFGERRLLIAGLLLGAAISLWQASLPPFPLMLASRLLEGFSHLAIVVAAPTLISRISHARFIGAAMTLWSTFFGVSFALVAWVALPLLGDGGIPTLFASHGGFMIAIAALVALSIPEQARETGPDALPASGIIATHVKAYLSPHIAAPAAGWLFYTLTFVSLLALVPETLAPKDAAWAAGLMPLVSIAVSMLTVPILLRRVSGVSVTMLGFALAMPLVALAGLLDQPLVFAIALFAALGLVQGASFAAVPELNPDPGDQALAYGLLAQSGNCGNLLGTPILLAILGAQGPGGMYLSVVAIYLGGFLAHLLLAQRRGVARN
ncbi:MFS transporter [Tropicimonas sp. TH_r6]|uniref:MFS transporter n=1 Tax=Tropicimonas sp. TH_r6 TaxID=3082085 RepID=UPI002953697D|nr:MFS transporter [Tropicimonas sp. TH_r6]MDV7142148.1 MFS transporter [Tropicimonas sp. TH_r6]